MLLQVAAGERSASLVCICLGMLAFVALSDLLATLYTSELSYASSGVAWSVPVLALFQRGGSAGGGSLWRRAGAAGVSICTFVLVKQANWEPPAACASTEALCYGAAGGHRRLVDPKALVRL